MSTFGISAIPEVTTPKAADADVTDTDDHATAQAGEPPVQPEAAEQESGEAGADADDATTTLPAQPRE